MAAVAVTVLCAAGLVLFNVALLASLTCCSSRMQRRRVDSTAALAPPLAFHVDPLAGYPGYQRPDLYE
jgi:uncharacterized membrane protein (DUF4010 family)